jgi:hypothetical protein
MYRLTLMLICLLVAMAAGSTGYAKASPHTSNQPSLSQESKHFGSLEDEAKQPDHATADSRMTAIADTGLTNVKETVWVTPTYWKWQDLPPKDLQNLDNSMEAASHHPKVKVMLALWQIGWKYAPPVRPAQQRGNCDLLKDLVLRYEVRYPSLVGSVSIGVEPNSEHFWSPQSVDGANVSAETYVNWLGACYDKIKAAAPQIQVVGFELASRGDTPPLTFIAKACEAYRRSGRDRPLMDVFAQHSYGVNSQEAPDIEHPQGGSITIADYGKLLAALQCFRGTPQTLPLICWCEIGFQTEIPPEMAYRYRDSEPQSTHPIPEVLQGQYLARAIRMAACQPRTWGLFNLHIYDDRNLKMWQSGLLYPDGSPKASLLIVQEALEQALEGLVPCGHYLEGAL